jgi:PAS domain S-box-containing protein
MDWHATALGPPHAWSQSLRAAVRICLDSGTTMAVWAGPAFTLLCNDSYLPVLGARAPGALGKPGREVWSEVWDVLGPEMQGVWDLKGSTYHANARFSLLRQGREEEAFFNYSLSPVRDDDGRVVALFNVLEETTAKVREGNEAEREALLRRVDENRRQLQALMDAIPAGVFISDARGKLLQVNDYARKIWGGATEASSWEQYDLWKGYWPATGKRLTASEWAASRALASGEPVLGEVIDIERFDGTRGTILNSAAAVKDAAGRTIGAITINLDISEQRRVEEALRRSEARWNAAIEHFREGAIIATEQEQVIYWNPAARAMHGFRAEGEGIGPLEENSKTFELWTPDGARLLPPEEWPMRRLKRGEAVRGMELRLRRPDQGWERIVSYSGAMVDTAGGERLIFLSVHDLTAQREAEQWLHAANAQLRETDQRKNEFLAVLSHELRNPLAPVRNSLYVLERAAPGGDQARRAMAVIDRQVSQLSHLVDDLLDVTRITRNKVQLRLQQLELNEVVRRTLEDHRSVFEQHQLEVEPLVSPEPVHVRADWHRIAQVLGNLLTNAAKFTSVGGKVQVSVEKDPSAGQAVIAVSDTGIGISAEMLERLFQPFMQADTSLDRSKGGLGLGLALVKGLVDLHGGSITAHSEGEGTGARFTVRLPLELPDALDSSSQRGAPDAARRRILVIEDNRDAADSLREVLELGKHEVQVAYDGPSGLLQAQQMRPEVVFCDIGLPGMDGYEVARRLRADPVTRHCLLVALSGYGLPDDLQRAADAGFDRHLTKPPSMQELQQTLESVSQPGQEGPEHFEGKEA